MKVNLNKTICARQNGILISYRESKYKTSFTEYVQNVQLNGTTKYQNIEHDAEKTLNPLQERLYRQAIYGLSIYTSEELNNLSNKEKTIIKTRQTKTQKILNLWKQEICNEMSNKFLSVLFPNSKLVKNIVEMDDTDEFYTNLFSFKDLKLDKFKIVQKLIDSDILPIEFFELNITN
jgi:hypothetical protein